MGVILAKFRKQKTTYQILEKLEDDIKEAEALTISTKEKQRRFVVNLYLVSIGLLIVGCLLYYFYFLPPTWSKRIVYATPLLAASILVICLGRLGSWFFQKRLNKNSNNLTKLREEKKKIIEKVMDTEKYKVAIELLNRFGDKTNTPKVQSNIGAINRTPVPSTIINRNLTQARNRIGQTPLNTLDRAHVPTTPAALIAPNTPITNNPSRAYVSPYRTPLSSLPSNYQLQYHTQVKTPFPIINYNEKKFFDKILDFLMGEGQSSLYGMVCKECYGHNGMASLEEYEYSAFRCAYCKVLNPARKIRPKAPALSIENIGSTIQSSSSTSSSDRDSGSENDEQGKSPVTVSPSTDDVSQQQESEASAEPSADDDNVVQPSELSEDDKLDENVVEKSAIDKKCD